MAYGTFQLEAGKVEDEICIEKKKNNSCYFDIHSNSLHADSVVQYVNSRKKNPLEISQTIKFANEIFFICYKHLNLTYSTTIYLYLIFQFVNLNSLRHILNELKLSRLYVVVILLYYILFRHHQVNYNIVGGVVRIV